MAKSKRRRMGFRVPVPSQKPFCDPKSAIEAAFKRGQEKAKRQAQPETETMIYFARAGRAGVNDIFVRSPELRVLREKTLAVFGLGCLGAPSTLEFARAGIGELRIVDRDLVDLVTIGRWPFGLSAAGLPKALVLADFIPRNYPSTRLMPEVHCIGGVREPGGDVPSDLEVIDRVIEGASAIYDATAEIGVQHYLSRLAHSLGIPYIGVVGTYGGWGGKIVSIVPGRTEGCWMCYRCAFEYGTIPEPPSDPKGEVQPQGCGDVTFTGAGFDMAQIALAGVRTTVSILCGGVDGSYPVADWDMMTISFRNEDGRQIAPVFRDYKLARHPNCPYCSNS